MNIVGCSQQGNSIENKEIKQDNEVIQKEDKKEIPSNEKIINTLCSDDFGGRLTGSDGDKKAEQYISGILKDLKLEPIFAGEYYEPYTQEVYKKYGLIDENDIPENKEVHNLIGVIKGSDSTKAVVVSAHFDHIGYQEGQIIRGALDNASGVATVIKMIDILKKESENKTFNEDIVFAFFDGEEEGQQGSKAFVSYIKDKYSSLYNINIDCVGGKQAGKISLNNTSKISHKLTDAMKSTFKSNGMDFSEVKVKNDTSDQKSFEKKSIPNIYIGQDNLKPYIHNPTDNPDSINYDEINKVAEVLSDFIETNDGNAFND